MDDCPPDTPSCDDCNVNGVPDGCDVDPLDPDGDGQVSADDNEDGVPDECVEATGSGDWSGDIWGLGGDYPDNDPKNPSGVPDLSVTLDGENLTVFADVTVEISSLRLLNAASLDVTQAGDQGDLTIFDPGGVFEAVTIRTIRLRDFGGTVHTMPFNEVSTILNLTKDFSRYVFEIGIAYREDVDQVIEVLKQIGAEMQEDEEFGPAIIQPLEVMGLDKFADSAVVIKARITTQPIKQWMVGREFNRRMKIRFDELGIEIPFPHQTVYFGEDKSGAAAPAYVRMMEGEERKAAAKPQPARRASSTATSTTHDPSDIAEAGLPGGSGAGGDGDL